MESLLNVHRSIVLIGQESVGKTRLATALAQKSSRSENYRGSTIACEVYRVHDFTLVDTPGILRDSDSRTTELALAEIDAHDIVILVAQATHLDEDLAQLLPLVAGRLYWFSVNRTKSGCGLWGVGLGQRLLTWPRFGFFASS